MTTKDLPTEKHNLIISGPNHNDQYSNLNLNKTHKCLNVVNSVETKNLFNKNGGNFRDQNLQIKKEINNSWRKLSKRSDSVDYLTSYNSDKEKEKRRNDLKSANNNSTLSLHIAAYENSIEAKSDQSLPEIKPKTKIKFRKTWKHFFHGSSTLKESFEIPRQQENQRNEPEIMQFKASQQLLNPNESIPPKRRSIGWKNAEMQKLLDDFINGKLPFKDIQEFADHVNQISNTNVQLASIRNRINDRKRELKKINQNEAGATLAEQNESQPEASPVSATEMDPPALEDEDSVTHAELYQAYANFWNSLNNCLDDENKFHPANGIHPTFEEAQNLWRAMKKPRQRKILWVATGFLHDEFPGDEQAFRSEEAEGLIDETNVRDVANAQDDSDADDIPDLNDENQAPVENLNNGSPNALDRLYDAGLAEMEEISSEEDAPRNPINANIPLNNFNLSANGAVRRPETPLALIHDPVLPLINPVRTQMNSLTTQAPANDSPSDVPCVRQIEAPSPVSAWVTTESENEVVPDSQPDNVVDADNDNFFEEPDTSPPRSPVPESSQNSISSDSSVPTPQSSQIPVSTAPKKISPKRKRPIIINESDEDDQMVKAEKEEPSYIDELIDSPIKQTEKSKTVKKGKKRRQTTSPKPASSKRHPRTRSVVTTSSSKPSSSLNVRSRTRSAVRAAEIQNRQKAVNKHTKSRELDSDFESVESMPSDSDVISPASFDRDIDNINSGESTSSFETSSLDGFVVDSSEEDEDESSDEDVRISDDNTPTVQNSEDSVSSITDNDDIFTRDDSVERDLPSTIPKATLTNTPTTPKTTPLLAHIGKPRYSSEAATPRRFVNAPLSSKPSSFIPRRESANVDSSAGRRNLNANSFNAQRRDPSSERPGPSNARRAPSTEHSPVSPPPRPLSRERRESTSDSRRSTSNNRFGSLTRYPGDDGSDSRSDSRNDSATPDGYEFVNNDRKVYLSDAKGEHLLIIEEQKGKKFSRKYRPKGNGLYKNLGCFDFYCVSCQLKGKETFLKVIKRNNKTYADPDHHQECKLKPYADDEEEE